MIHTEDAGRLGIRKGKIFLKEHEDQKHHHAEEKIMRVHDRERRLSGKSIVLGKFTIEDPADHREDRIPKSGVHIFFHTVVRSFLSLRIAL